MLKNLPLRIVELAAKGPRGGFLVARSLTKLFPSLRECRVQTRYGPIYCDLSESVCWPLVKFHEYPHWRPDEAMLARLPIDPEGLILDVGANIGVMTRIFAFRAREVFAFEPAPRAWRLLRANTSDLPNVRLHALALSNVEGPLHFAQRTALDISSISDEQGLEVCATTIDALQVNPTLIKIDVEGFEHRVLQGATATLANGPTIIFEALNETAREYCERIIQEANPAYRFATMGGGSNHVAHVLDLLPKD